MVRPAGRLFARRRAAGCAGPVRPRMNRRSGVRGVKSSDRYSGTRTFLIWARVMPFICLTDGVISWCPNEEFTSAVVEDSERIGLLRHVQGVEQRLGPDLGGVQISGRLQHPA